MLVLRGEPRSASESKALFVTEGGRALAVSHSGKGDGFLPGCPSSSHMEGEPSIPAALLSGVEAMGSLVRVP